MKTNSNLYKTKKTYKRRAMAKKITNLKDSCAHCQEINCIDLFSNSKDDDLVGGELFLYNQLHHSMKEDEDLSLHICANGRLLECACFIISTLDELFPDDYLIIVSNEVVRDMKTSFYLAMSGHYRQAILIQRCVFENFLYGFYFYTEYYKFSKDETDKKELHKKFLSWINGSFRKKESDLIDIIRRGECISKEEIKLWLNLFKNLSQFVHTIQKTHTGEAIKCGKNIEMKSCYSEVEFNKDKLIEWSRYYQAVFFLILNKLISKYPAIKKEEPGKLALEMLRTEFRGKTKELNNRDLENLLKMRVRKTD